MRELAFWQVWQCDVDDLVPSRFVMAEGGAAGVEDGGFGNLKIRFVDTYDFVFAAVGLGRGEWK